VNARDTDRAHAQAHASDDLYTPVDEATLRSVAAWLRRLARSYGGGAPARMEAVARIVEQHN
jgi:hypothetical protein